MEQFLMGIDIGTSSCKLTIVDLDGEVRAGCTENYPTYYSEQLIPEKPRSREARPGA
jgi:sugar (pentulose or hexulose) kinase